VGIGYIGIIIYYLVLDYARIYTISNDERKMRRALWYGIKFTFRNFFRTFSLTLMLFLIGIIVLVIYNPIADSLHAPSGFIIFTLFIAQQIYMFIRMTLKLTLYSSQVKLYNALTPKEEIVEPSIENA
jgi:energy-coupling factor transporter transmembrane protein EcfT